jgi:hypothetical protein
MPVTLNIVNPSDAVEVNKGSYANQAVRNFDGTVSAFWFGRATVPSSGAVASIPVYRYEPQLGFAGNAALSLPANAAIVRLAFLPLGALTLGAATGKLKLGTTLTNSTAGLSATSAAASSNTLAAPTDYIMQNNILTPVTVGSSDVTYRIYATDGASLGSEAASTMTAAADTDILVAIGFVALDNLPLEETVFKKPTQITSNNY